MQILYLSRLASEAAIADDPSFIGNAVQKFNRLVAEGLSRNDYEVTALSTFYSPVKGTGYYRKRENVKGVNYEYIFSPNNHVLRKIWLTVYCFLKVLLWGTFGKKEKVLIADVLNISACMGAVAASRLVGLRRVGIVTDLPGLMVGGIDTTKGKEKKWFSIIKTKLNYSYLSHFSHYVFLTEQMNQAINIRRRPYIVMEGLVDADMQIPEDSPKENKKIIIYAGGLHERYGLKILVEGFMQTKDREAELWIYGNGPFAEALQEYSIRDPRVVYKGTRPNSEVVEAEIKATLLVNPRPTHESFTKYSFPSKNMEYMVSGTPVLTTKLPGMPLEYYPYVYLFDQGETSEGYAKVLSRIMSLPTIELQNKGQSARQWVLKNKNHIMQTYRIIEMLNVK